MFLVGPAGAGKSCTGTLLAQRLGQPFVDSDQEIERRTGCSVRGIFARDGEAAFRALECQLIRELVAREALVLATGGGAVLAPATRQLLQRCGRTVYLRAAVAVLAQRTCDDNSRPLLMGDDHTTRVQTLLEQREPCYRELAELTVDTDARTPAEVVEQICTWLHRERTCVP